MIHLDLQPEFEAQLASEAQARGLALPRYIEKLVSSRPSEQAVTESPAEAVAAIREGRKENRLVGLKIVELIQEGRRF